MKRKWECGKNKGYGDCWEMGNTGSVGNKEEIKNIGTNRKYWEYEKIR